MTSLSNRLLRLLAFSLLAVTLTAIPAYGQSPEYGLVNVSACNTRSEAAYSAGQESQAVMGMPAEILGRHHEWTHIRTPEGYEHWTLTSTLKSMSREQLTEWNQAEQAVVTALTTWIYEKPSAKSAHVSDAVGGDRLRYLGTRRGFIEVGFPDGRTGFISKKDAMKLSRWRREVPRDAASILHTAHTLMGVPYMWGGTSPKGVDCSGFVRTVLYLHDIIIPRNASQQALVGEHIKIAGDFSNLQPGDLLFFGSKNADGSARRVVHVGFSLGGKRFIHSLGRVHTGSFDPADQDYDEYELGRLLFAARILPYVNSDPKIQTTDRIPLYN